MVVPWSEPIGAVLGFVCVVPHAASHAAKMTCGKRGAPVRVTKRSSLGRDPNAVSSRPGEPLRPGVTGAPCCCLAALCGTQRCCRTGRLMLMTSVSDPAAPALLEPASAITAYGRAAGRAFRALEQPCRPAARESAPQPRVGPCAPPCAPGQARRSRVTIASRTSAGWPNRSRFRMAPRTIRCCRAATSERYGSARTP
jgi:hypothetical protein